MLNRGGKICLAAFPHDAVSGRRRAPGAQQHLPLRHPRRRQSATHRAMAFMAASGSTPRKIHTHTFQLDELPEALRYARDRVEDAIKVVVKTRPGAAAGRAAAE